MGGKKVKLGDAKHSQLRSVLAEGRLAGFWEYDPDPRAIAIGFLSGRQPGNLRKKAEAKAAQLAQWIADDLGHGRSFNLDTDKDLRERVRLPAHAFAST